MSRNAIARDLRTPKYRQRIINGRKYDMDKNEINAAWLMQRIEEMTELPQDGMTEKEKTVVARLKPPAVKTWQDEVAPRAWGWCACMGDYDLDVPVGRGASEREAIEDLLAQLDD